MGSPYKGFTTVELRKPKRSLFDLSHERRMSTRMGRLTPVFVSEVMPNDTFRCDTELMLRFAPMLAPVMHHIQAYVHYFFIPNRLLWKDWEAFITGGRLGTETPPVPPNTLISTCQAQALGLLDKGSLADYLGLNPIADADGSYAGRSIDLMPAAAFYKVWYDYYRDRNYVADDTILPLASGQTNVGATIQALFKRRVRDWEPDQFTSALPWTQRGNQVLLPLQGTGSVTYLATSLLKDSATGVSVSGAVTGQNMTGDLQVAAVDARVENISSVNLTASSVSINDVRKAYRLQEWLERNALAGSRYNESIWAHFNRRTSDGRLQRAEYLGGGKVTCKISEVVTTAYSEDAGAEVVPPANMAGHSLTFGRSNRFTYNCEEHGFIIGIMSIMPSSAYMQGSRKMWFGRNTFLDYPWPTFANLGEEAVYKYQLYSNSTNLPADRTTQPIFGYQSRYYDWKQIASSNHGDFRDTLDFWSLTRKFSSSPVLGETFCNFEDALQDRIFAVSGVDTMWCYIYNKCTAVRSLPYYGTPIT